MEQAMLESSKAALIKAAESIVTSWFGEHCALPGTKFGSHNWADCGHQDLSDREAEREEKI